LSYIILPSGSPSAGFSGESALVLETFSGIGQFGEEKKDQIEKKRKTYLRTNK
jgi:hypothetical protein